MKGSVIYYSTLPQLHAMLSRFAVGDLEKHLAVALMNALPRIAEEMRRTMQLTTEAASSSPPKQHQNETYLCSDNCKFVRAVFPFNLLSC